MTDARISREHLQVLAEPGPSARVSREHLQALAEIVPDARISRAHLQVLVRNSTLVLGGTASEADTAGEYTYASQIIADAPLFWLRFNEASGTVANDSSGNARHGAYQGIPSLNQPGLLSRDSDTAFAASSGKYAQIGYDAAWMFPTSWTMEAWIKPTGASIAILGRHTVAGQVFDMQLSSLKVQLRHNVAGQLLNSATTLELNKTYHIVGTWDATSMTQSIYINGVLDATRIATSVPTNSSAPFSFGAWGGNYATQTFNGVIDEAAFYDRALPATRVQAHYLAGSSYFGGESVEVDLAVGGSVVFGQVLELGQAHSGETLEESDIGVSVVESVASQVIELGQAHSPETLEESDIGVSVQTGVNGETVELGLPFESSSAEALLLEVGPVSVPLAQADETTDSALALTVVLGTWSATLAQGEESDSALSLTTDSATAVQIGQPSEQDDPQSLALALGANNTTIGQADQSETTSPVTISTANLVGIGTADQAESALAPVVLVGAVSSAIGRSSEADETSPITVVLAPVVIGLAQISELDEPWSLTLLIEPEFVDLGRSEESSNARAMGISLLLPMLAEEGNTCYPLTPVLGVVQLVLTQPSSQDQSAALTPVLTTVIPVQTIVEIETVTPLGISRTVAQIGDVSTVSSLNLLATFAAALGRPQESTDTFTLTPGLVNRLDLGRGIEQDLLTFLGARLGTNRIMELDSVQALTIIRQIVKVRIWKDGDFHLVELLGVYFDGRCVPARAQFWDGSQYQEFEKEIVTS